MIAYLYILPVVKRYPAGQFTCEVMFSEQQSCQSGFVTTVKLRY